MGIEREIPGFWTTKRTLSSAFRLEYRSYENPGEKFSSKEKNNKTILLSREIGTHFSRLCEAIRPTENEIDKYEEERKKHMQGINSLKFRISLNIPE